MISLQNKTDFLRRWREAEGQEWERQSEPVRGSTYRADSG